MKKLVKSTYFKIALTVVVVGMLLLLFRNWVAATNFAGGISKFNSTMQPIYIGCFIAFVMCPIYNKIVKLVYHSAIGESGRSYLGTNVPCEKASNLNKRRSFVLARIVASVVCFGIILGLLFLIGYFILPEVIKSVITVGESMPQRLATFSRWSSVQFKHFPAVVEWINKLANSGTKEILAWIEDNLLNQNASGQKLAQALSQGVMSVLSTFINLFIGMLIAIYLLNYKEKLFAITKKMVEAIHSQKHADGLYEFGNIINNTFIGFIVGRILDALIIWVLTYLVLRIFNISMPLLISTIVGVTNVIPFFGPFLGAIPSVFLLLLENPIEALWFIIIIACIQQLDGNVIGPNIVGSAIGLPSFWVLIAVLVGGGLFGFLGMFLGVPTFAVIYKYVARLTKMRLKNKEKTTNTFDYYNLDKFGIDKEELELERVDKKSNKKRRNR